MRLEKHYFDVVTARGDVFMAYAARLRLPGGIRLPWRAAFAWQADGGAWQRQGMGGSRVQVANDIGLHVPRLQVSAHWKDCEVAPELVLLDEPPWRIRWQVLARASRAQWHAADTQGCGLGYAERLSIELKLARLPMCELHWGRFISDDAQRSLVWIAWRGGVEREWLLLDGVPLRLQGLRIDCERVAWPQGTLDWTPARVLVDQSIGAHFPAWMNRLWGEGLVCGHERKHLSRGQFSQHGGGTCSGWVVHEVVRWPQAG